MAVGGGGGGGTIANLQVVVGADVAAALLGFATLQGAISGVVDAVKGFISSGIEMNSFLESSELQFKTLTGSATAAHDKVADLFDLAAHTPFTFESVTVAARQLEVFGGAALDTRENLVMMGDAAAATAAPIEQVTFWTGRLYSALQAGEPIGMATMWLQRMGVLSSEATQRMKALSDSGASADVVWQAFTASMGRFSGAMKEQEGTWKGLTSTMQDTFTLLEGMATRGLFKDLEAQVKGLNATLESPQAAQQAQATSDALQLLAHEGEGLGRTIAETAPAFQVASAAMGVYTAATKDAYAATLQMESAGTRIASVMEAAGSPMVATANQVRDSWAEAAHAMDAAQEKLAGAAGGPRDEGTRAMEQQRILDQQRQTAHDAEMQRLYDEGQALAHQGDISQIVAREQISAQQFATQQREDLLKKIADAEEKNRRQAAENERATFNATADAIRQKNQETADAIRTAQQAAQEAVRRAYVGTADEAEAQYQRIIHASQGVADSATDMQQQIDEAINSQVRGGTAGTSEAEQQLDDIRRRYLATLPDLAALDRQWTDAKVQSRQADLALAAAQRDLAVALARTGGQQTLETAALSHAVTAAQAADQAARDHAAALGQERGEAVSATNALKGLADQRKALADDAASRQIGGMPGGGPWQPGMGGGGGDNTAHIDPSYWTRNLSALDPRNILQPTIVTHVTINGNVTTTQKDFQQSVVDAVQQADRQNGLNLTRYAPR